MKRPAAAMVKAGFKKVTAEPEAKRQHKDPMSSKCSAIAQLIESAEGHAPEVLQMLAGCIKTCLTEPKEARHEIQNQVVEMLTDVLASVEAQRTAAVEESERKVAELNDEQSVREAAVETAEAVQREQAEAVEAARQGLDAAKVEIETAKAEVVAAVAEQEAGDAELLQAEGRKAAAEAVVSTELLALKEGTAADAAAAVQTVKKVGKDLALEAQLLDSGAVALTQAPALRAAFDTIVVQQLDEQFGTAVARLTNVLASGATGKVERASKVEACQKKQEAAIAYAEVCKEKLTVAEASLVSRGNEQDVAKASLKEIAKDIKKAGVVAKAAKAPLSACKEVLVMFQELVEGAVAPEPMAVEMAEETTQTTAEKQAGELVEDGPSGAAAGA